MLAYSSHVLLREHPYSLKHAWHDDCSHDARTRFASLLVSHTSLLVPHPDHHRSNDVYDASIVGSVRPPTLALMAQSMMWPENATRISSALHALWGPKRSTVDVSCVKGTAPVQLAKEAAKAVAQPGSRPLLAYVEVAGLRHQEFSDFAMLLYLQVHDFAPSISTSTLLPCCPAWLPSYHPQAAFLFTTSPYCPDRATLFACSAASHAWRACCHPGSRCAG